MRSIKQIEFKLEPNFNSQFRGRRKGVTSITEDIRLLGEINRLGVTLVELEEGEVDGLKTIFVKLRCFTETHPSCEFKWLEIEITFPGLKDLIVKEVIPDLVTGEQPIKISTTYKGGVSVEFSKLKIGPNVELEETRETEIFFSEVIGRGVGLDYAKWVFETPEGKELHVNRDVSLLATHFSGEIDVNLDITIRTKIKTQGIARALPFIGRKKYNVTRRIPL